MDTVLISKITRQVCSKFPEVKGATPQVRPQDASHSLLVYQAAAVTADGKRINRTVRVVAETSTGKVVKMTTSR